jgi:ankyrin repeat protein
MEADPVSELNRAAERGDLDAIRAALDAGADIDAQDERGRTAVMAATYAHRTDAVRLLFEHGADPDIRDEMLNNPFLYAGAEGYLDILKLANVAGADPTIVNRFGGVALIPASEHGYVETVRYLLEETDIDVDHVNKLGWTALLEAIILNDGGPNQREVIRLLIEHGADVDLADGEGVTPLAHAQARGFSEIVAILLAAGATR